MKSIEVTEYINKFDSSRIKRINEIRDLIHEILPDINEKLWTGVPCFYSDDKFILIRIFSKHVNIVADSILKYKNSFEGYSITPKGMLQILDTQKIPSKGMRQMLKACGKSIK